MKWFKNVNTLAELKKAYRELAKKHHPDVGGSLKEMQEINLEYETLFARLPKEDSKKERHSVNDGYREIIDQIINLNITIEIIGSWVWVSGETYPIKEQLKEAGLKWSKNRKMWYWHSGEYIKKGKSKLTMEEIKDYYGSEKIKESTKDSQHKLIA